MQNQYANYVVQHVLQKEPRMLLPALTACAIPHLIPLSMQKYSSNVLEKCLQLADDAAREQWMTALAQPEAVVRLHRDAFGNYVLQAALQSATASQRQPVLAILTPLLQQAQGTRAAAAHPHAQSDPHVRRFMQAHGLKQSQ